MKPPEAATSGAHCKLTLPLVPPAPAPRGRANDSADPPQARLVLHILITADTLGDRKGSELYTRDLAVGLLTRGHRPVAYTTILGDVADDLAEAGVPVITELDHIEEPLDLIHGQHHLETMVTLTAIRDVPAVYTCHSSTVWIAGAPAHPRIRKYLPVDIACRDRVIEIDRIPEDQVEVVLNPVDLTRFRRREALPLEPQRALIFSNYANARTHLGAVTGACAARGIEVDVVGSGVGNPVERPEEILGDYDIVFAKARCALEAMAVGCAVIACDSTGLGHLVTRDSVESMRLLNFGIRALDRDLDPGLIADEIARYDPEDARRVSDHIRKTAGAEEHLDVICEIYQQVVSDWHRAERPSPAEEADAVSTYIASIKPRLIELEAVSQEYGHMYASRDELRSELLDLRAAHDKALAEVAALHGRVEVRLRDWVARRIRGRPSAD